MYLMFASLCLSLHTPNTFAQNIEKVLATDREGLALSQRAQEKVNVLDDQAQSAQIQYRQILREQQLANKYQSLLSAQVKHAEEVLQGIQKKQKSLRHTRMMLMPLMQEMLKTLSTMIQNDTPFLIPERQARLRNLQQKLQDPSLSSGEQMLSLLDAYQVELSYGYSIESWQGKFQNKLVTFVRIGRLGYYYFSVEAQQVAVWQDQWKPLPKKWIPYLKQAQQVASGEIPPHILTLPLLDLESL